MGLQNELSDISSESILMLAVVLIGKSASYLHSLFFNVLHHLGLFAARFEPEHHHENSPYGVVGSGLAGLIFLCEQLNLNRDFSYAHRVDDGHCSDCVVCLNRMGEGEKVRKLTCCHVFHKECFDGWLDHFNFNCPLCRAPLVSGERVDVARRRVSEDVLAWFTSQ